MNKPTKLLSAMLLALATGVMLAACGNSEDGPQLSDEEKIKQASQGREQQMGQQGGAPSAADQSTTGQ